MRAQPDPAPAAQARRARRGRLLMLAVLLLCAAPVIASYLMFYVVRPGARSNYSTLVQRGWLPRDAAERTRLAPHHTPTGKVVVEGHLRPEPARLYELSAGGDAGGVIRQNLEVVAFARESGLPLRPLLVAQAADPADAAGDDGLLRRWPAPSSGADKNRGYALQWFALAALITGLYVWFQLIRPRLAGRR